MSTGVLFLAIACVVIAAGLYRALYLLEVADELNTRNRVNRPE